MENHAQVVAHMTKVSQLKEKSEKHSNEATKARHLEEANNQLLKQEVMAAHRAQHQLIEARLSHQEEFDNIHVGPDAEQLLKAMTANHHLESLLNDTRIGIKRYQRKS